MNRTIKLKVGESEIKLRLVMLGKEWRVEIDEKVLIGRSIQNVQSVLLDGFVYPNGEVTVFPAKRIAVLIADELEKVVRKNLEKYMDKIFQNAEI